MGIEDTEGGKVGGSGQAIYNINLIIYETKLKKR